MGEQSGESKPLKGMHWSAGSASSFARFVIVVELFVLWLIGERINYGSISIVFKLPQYSAEGGSDALMVIWFATALILLLLITAFAGILRSAKLQGADGIALPAIKHSLISDLVLTIVGFGFLAGAAVSHAAGTTADVVVGVGAGAMVFTGIIGFHYLHQFAISAKS